MSLDVATRIDLRRRARRNGDGRRRRTPNAQRVGIVLPNWIGDVVMATPALRALRRHLGPEAELVGIMNPVAANVLEGTEFVDDVMLYQRRTRSADQGLFGVARRLRQRRLDSLLLLTNSFSSALLGWLARVRQRVGYARYGRWALLTTPLHPPRDGFRLTPISAVDYFLHLVYAVGCPVEPPRLELAVTAADRAAADGVLQQLHLDTDRPLVTLNNGGGYGAAKKWPEEHWIDLARQLVAQTEASVLIVCGPTERREAARIERGSDSARVCSLAGWEPSIGLTKACIARSRVVVSTDSGIRHFAAAFGVPCVTLFGPSDPRWSHNYHRAEQILRMDLPCAPCGRRKCPLRHHRCMRDLHVSGVLQALRQQLNSST